MPGADEVVIGGRGQVPAAARAAAERAARLQRALPRLEQHAARRARARAPRPPPRRGVRLEPERRRLPGLVRRGIRAREPAPRAAAARGRPRLLPDRRSASSAPTATTASAGALGDPQQPGRHELGSLRPPSGRGVRSRSCSAAASTSATASRRRSKRSPSSGGSGPMPGCWSPARSRSPRTGRRRPARSIRRLGLEDAVELLGPYTQAEAPALMRRADLLLHTKYNDPCPTVVLEAMASGLPGRLLVERRRPRARRRRRGRRRPGAARLGARPSAGGLGDSPRRSWRWPSASTSAPRRRGGAPSSVSTRASGSSAISPCLRGWWRREESRRRVQRRVDPLLQGRPADRTIGSLYRLWVSAITREPTEVALRRLLILEDHLADRIDLLAIDLDDGVHAKHRLTGYHDFFVERVSPGETVLDVGCGKGELAHDLAVRGGAIVTGIDVNRASLDVRPGALRCAQASSSSRRTRSTGSRLIPTTSSCSRTCSSTSSIAWSCSRGCGRRPRPKRMLIRLPMSERDWLVPLREELGLALLLRSDALHRVHGRAAPRGARGSRARGRRSSFRGGVSCG